MSEDTPITDGATFEGLSTLQSRVMGELIQRFELELAVERAKYKVAVDAFNKEVGALERKLSECRDALNGALVLADCLADTKDDPAAFRGNNDNYMRIVDALKQNP